jgi:hypothetical protein
VSVSLANEQYSLPVAYRVGGEFVV